MLRAKDKRGNLGFSAVNGDKNENSRKRIDRVTNLGIACNIVLAVVKVSAGITAGSMSLVADGIHSISDMITDVAVLLGVHFGSKEPDLKHPYGHGRIETFSAVFIAVILIVVGGFMVQRASLAIARFRPEAETGRHLSAAVFWVAVLSILAKEGLYRVTQKVAVRTHSSALYANAWHHRSDALSSVAVVIGFVMCRFGYVYGDEIAAVAVGLMIILVGVKIIGDCLGEFTESAVDTDTIEHIKAIISSEERIRQWHKLRSRNVGREVFLDLHILVDPELSITDAHEIAESLENAMHAGIVRPVNITVHIEPDRPELRK